MLYTLTSHFGPWSCKHTKLLAFSYDFISTPTTSRVHHLEMEKKNAISSWKAEHPVPVLSIILVLFQESLGGWVGAVANYCFGSSYSIRVRLGQTLNSALLGGGSIDCNNVFVNGPSLHLQNSACFLLTFEFNIAVIGRITERELLDKHYFKFTNTERSPL